MKKLIIFVSSLSAFQFSLLPFILAKGKVSLEEIVVTVTRIEGA